MQPAPATDDLSWTSAGLARPEAVRQWQDWAASTIAPIDVCVFDEGDFAARWSSHGVGQLRLLRLDGDGAIIVGDRARIVLLALVEDRPLRIGVGVGRIECD